jgi:hypothetical protein
MIDDGRRGGGNAAKQPSLAWSLAALLTAGAGACRSAPPSHPAAPPSGPAKTLPPQPAPSARPANTLRWKTNDVSNFGYDIYRAESEAGPFVKINAQVVPGTLKPGKVQNFEYVDDTIDPRQDYWYYVESISLMGERLKFTPTLHAPAKSPRTPR